MKRIEAIIQPFKVEAVKDQLLALGVAGMTVSEIWGSGQQGGILEYYRGTLYTVPFLPKIKVEVLTDDEHVEAIMAVIIAAAKTGKIGDGKIVLTPVSDVVRIRTGDRGVTAL